jgi:hypothetical protein
MFRRERNARRTAKSIRDHQDTMEAFRRTTAKPYNPDAKIDYREAKVYSSPFSADITAYTPGKDEKTPGKHWTNNVRKMNRWEKK